MTKHKFKGKNIYLVRRKERLPNDAAVEMDVVEHPGAVAIIPMLDKDRIVFLRQYRPAVREYLYEIPAGTLDAGEKPLPCARRELQEETGYAAKRFAILGQIYPLPAYSNEWIIIYKAEGLTEKSVNRDKDEIMDVEILTRKEIKSFFEQGRIKDAKTICALAFAGLLSA